MGIVWLEISRVNFLGLLSRGNFPGVKFVRSEWVAQIPKMSGELSGAMSGGVSECIVRMGKRQGCPAGKEELSGG